MSIYNSYIGQCRIAHGILTCLQLSICDPAQRNPQKVAEPQSKIQPIFDQWGVIPPSWFFLLITVPGCLFHNFLQTKLLKSI